MRKYPNLTPIITINAVSEKRLLPEIEFKRNSTLHYTDKDGWLRVAPVNTPVFEWDYENKEILGIPFPNHNSNYALNSENLNASNWINTNLSITSSNELNPKELSGCQLVTATSAGGSISSNISVPFVSGKTIAACNFSFFVKDPKTRYIVFEVTGERTNGETFPKVTIDTENMTIVSNRTGYAKVTKYAGGWYHVMAGAYTRIDDLGIRSYDNVVLNIRGSDTLGGNGVAGEWFKIWGLQYSRGSAGHSWYIPTTNSAVTTSVTLFRIFNKERLKTDQFTFIADWISARPCNNNGFIACLNGEQVTENNYFGLGYVTGNSVNTSVYFVNSNNNPQTTTLTMLGVAVALKRYTVGATWKAGSKLLTSYAQSGTYGTEMTLDVPFNRFDSIAVGGRSSTGGSMVFNTSGWLRSLSYYNKSMTLQELRSIVR